MDPAEHLKQILNNKAKQEKQQQSKAQTKKKAKQHIKPLNILLLYADDWRYDTLGIAGNPVVQTPVLDQLAKEGMRFTENCVTSSICWISRATLYTGMYLARHKFEMLGGRYENGTEGPQLGFEMPKNETIYALLKHHGGYHVGHAGKLGLWTEIDNHLHMDYFVDEDTWHYKDIDGKLWHITEKNTHDAMQFLQRRPRHKPFFFERWLLCHTCRRQRSTTVLAPKYEYDTVCQRDGTRPTHGHRRRLEQHALFF
mmetsp:Transcript_24177/g.36765  ORF Transcript_24177/g.36765 Transcript_24177/m.36765 type:complete len:255 (+) Transcript_24177:1626-2390(+)